MFSYEDKCRHASEALVLAVDLVSDCIISSSKRVTNLQMERRIEKIIDEIQGTLEHTIRFEVQDEAVNLYDGERDLPHAHVAIRQMNGETYYWRNLGENHGAWGNYLN